MPGINLYSSPFYNAYLAAQTAKKQTAALKESLQGERGVYSSEKLAITATEAFRQAKENFKMLSVANAPDLWDQKFYYDTKKLLDAMENELEPKPKAGQLQQATAFVIPPYSDPKIKQSTIKPVVTQADIKPAAKLPDVESGPTLEPFDRIEEPKKQASASKDFWAFLRSVLQYIMDCIDTIKDNLASL